MSGKMFNTHLACQTSFPECDSHFSQGLRVLAIDDNVVCLKVLAFELNKCGYQVTITTKAVKAIEILRKNRDNYDIVITDVMRSDMDVFKLLEIIGLEMGIPVIMTSANDDLKVVEKGVMHGACDYLVKPVRFEILKNIWQHVIRKTTYDPIPAQRIEANRANRIPTQQLEANMENRILAQKVETNRAIRRSTRNAVLNKKNHTMEDRQNIESHNTLPILVHKKARVTWTQELHAKFLAAVQQLGKEAVPKKILKLMNEPHLTRENVASHLQKYRTAALKQNEKIREEIEYHCDANRRRHLYDTNIQASSSDNQDFHAMNHSNSSTAYGSKSLRSQNPLLLPLNHQSDLFLEQDVCLVPSQSQDMNYIQQPVLTPTPLLTVYPDVQPNFNAIEHQPIQYQRNENTTIDCEQISLQIPLSGAIDTSASQNPGFLNTLRGDISSQTSRSISEIVTCPRASGDLINHSNHLVRDAIGQATSLPGHHEARTLVAYSGNGSTDSRGKAETTSLVLDMQAQVDGLIGDDHDCTQLFNSSDINFHGLHRNDSLGDQLRAFISQFSEDATPTI